MERGKEVIFLDTNAVIYLFSAHDKIPEKARKAIEANDLYVSPMLRLELQYLYEIGRAKQKPQTVLEALYKDIGLTVHNHDFDSIILHALHAPWTRDPFDRIITAHAQAMKSPLITTDHVILQHYKHAFWK